MDLIHFRHFMHAYQNRNFSRAAAEIPMSPQGLARSIHALERHLGVPLFTVGKGSQERVPTPYAHALARFLMAREDTEKALKNEFLAIKRQEERIIRLYVPAGFASLFSDSFIRRFEEDNPPCVIELEEVSDKLCDQGLLEGQCDIAFTKNPFRDEFETRQILHISMAYWVNRASPLSTKSSISVADLNGRDVCLYSQSYKMHDITMELMRKEGVVPRSISRTVETHAAYSFAAAGGDAGQVPVPLTRIPMFNMDKRVMTIPSSDLVLEFGVSRLKGRAHAPHERRFYDYCIQQASRPTRELLSSVIRETDSPSLGIYEFSQGAGYDAGSGS